VNVLFKFQVQTVLTERMEYRLARQTWEYRPRGIWRKRFPEKILEPE